MTHRLIPPILTPPWRRRSSSATTLRGVLIVLALASVLGWSATGRAQAQPTYYPEAPATNADLEALRAEMKQQAEAAQRRLEAHER